MQAIYQTFATKTQVTGKNLEVTDDIVSLNETTNAYALGYVDTEKLPKCFLPSILVNDGTNISFEFSYQKGYYPCGYMCAVFVNSGGLFTSEYLPVMQEWYKTSNGVTHISNNPVSANNTKRRYINNFYPEYAGYTQRNNYSAVIQFTGFVYNSGDVYDGTFSPQINGWMNCYNFLHGTYSFTYYYRGEPFTISPEDFEEDGTAFIVSNNETYKARLFITNYYFPERNQAGLHFAVFGLRGNIFGVESDFTIGANQLSGANSGILFTEMDKFKPAFVNPFGLSGMHGTFNIDILKTNPAYIYDGNVLGHRNNSSQYAFQLFYSIDEILKHMSFMCRICANGTNLGTDSYVENVTFATHVSENNEFLGELITGDLSDDTFKSKLREWQYSEDGVSVNEFNPEIDIPVYPDPDNPDDPDSDITINPARSEGDNMNPLTSRVFSTSNGFITLYNVSQAQLETFGKVLWKSVADYQPNMNSALDNFYVNLGTEVTGTFDTSAIMDYIISVRQYPFSVGTLPISQQSSDNNIYIGNGKVGIPISTNPRKLTSSIGYIDAGSVSVTPITPYNDFRDYFNTVVTLFLPYCGTVELSATEVINTTLSCTYAIDFYTGECMAFVTVDNGLNQYIISVGMGSIGVMIPITSTNSAQLQARKNIDYANNARLISSFAQGLINAGTAVASGDIRGFATGQGLQQIAESTVRAVEIESNRMSRSGVSAPYLSGGSGVCSFAQPDSVYLQIRRGTYKRANNYPSTVGYPNTISGRLGDFSGFTICKNPKLSGLTCNDEEKYMISELLQLGVYV